MDVRFDANAAEQLLRQMNKYCSGVQREAKELLSLIDVSGQWNDNQRKAFQANIRELAKDLNETLSLEADYMETFYKRVKELRG